MFRTTLALAAVLAVGIPATAFAAPMSGSTMAPTKHCRGANGRFVKCSSAASAMSKNPMMTASPIPKRSHHKKS